MSIDERFFEDHESLVLRLLDACSAQNKSVVFLVGSAFSASLARGAPGVPDVRGMLDLICEEAMRSRGDAAQALAAVKLAIGDPPRVESYQNAFQKLYPFTGCHA